MAEARRVAEGRVGGRRGARQASRGGVRRGWRGLSSAGGGRKKDKKRAVAAASRVRVMGQRVRCRAHCHGPTHAVKLLIAMAAVGIRATVAAPSAACRRLAALMEQEEQAEQQRRAAELQAEREKTAEARRAAEKQGIDPKTEEINRYIAGKFAAWLEVHGEVAGYDAALGLLICVVAPRPYSLSLA